MRRANQREIGGSLPFEVAQALDGWRVGEGPLYLRLADAFATAIEARELLPGTRLPPERVLANQLGLGRATVSAAYRLLAQQGLIARRQGRGTEIIASDGTLVATRAAELTTSLQRNILFRRLGEASPKAIDLLGSCAPPSLPVRDALKSAAAGIDIEELTAEHGYFPLGYPPLRRAVAAHLAALGVPTHEKEVLITGGAQQAISLLVACYVGPGAVVVLEDPTFPGAVDALRTAGARILTVPVREGGTDIGLLRSTLAESRVKAVYVMPTFHNPTGALMLAEARRELAQLSRICGMPVIEDNTLAELALKGEPPPPLAAYSSDAPIASIGSLSKLFWAGLRIGWIRAPQATIAQLGRLKAVADLGTSLFSQAIATRLLADVGAIRDVRRSELAESLALLEQLLAQLLPGWTWLSPQGGVSLWARLPHGSSTEFAQVAGRYGVSIAPGSVMSATARFDEFVRLPFDHEHEALTEGVKRLAIAWTSYTRMIGADGSNRLSVAV